MNFPIGDSKASLESGGVIEFGLEESKESPTQKTQVFGAFGFQDYDEDDDMKFIPKNAKVSKNIGRETPTAMGPKSFGKVKGLGFVAPATHNRLEIKDHPLHRPVDRYFSDKQEKRNLMGVTALGPSGFALDTLNATGGELQFKQRIDHQHELLEEIDSLEKLIELEKSKMKICYLCKRKFRDLEHLDKHKEFSQLHKSNMLKSTS